MEIVWTAEAERHLEALADSCLATGNTHAATDIVRKTMERVGTLADSPFAGQRLEGRDRAYRSIAITLYLKVIYRVVAHKVVVIALWDCRREPLDLSGIPAG